MRRMKEYIVPVGDKENMNMIENELHLQQLVRCKDCKYWHETIYNTPKWILCMSVQTSGNWFCADGEARK